MRHAKMKYFAMVLILSLAASSAYALKLNDKAPGFSLLNSRGEQFDLNTVLSTERETHGQGVVVNFFASWCIPCKKELPIINSQVDELSKKNITVIIIAVKENFDRINPMLNELKIAKPVVLADPRGKTSEKYGVRVLPTTFFIDAHGTVKKIIYGEIEDEKELTDGVLELLKK